MVWHSKVSFDRKAHFTKIGFFISLITGLFLFGQMNFWWRTDMDAVIIASVLFVVGFLLMSAGVKMAIRKRGGY